LEFTRSREGTNLRSTLFDIIRFSLKSNLLVALGAGFLSLVAGRLQQWPAHWITFAITFFHIYAMHALNHILDRGAAEYNDPDRSQFYKKFRTLFALSGTGAALFSLALAFSLGLAPFFLLAAMSVLGILYSYQIVPAVWQRFMHMKKIKDIPASKSLSVALGWGGVTTLIPAMGQHHPLSLALIITFLIICAFVYIRSGLFDILDIQGDMIVGKETLPIIIGEEKTIRFLKGLSLGTLVLLFLGIIFRLFPLWGLWLMVSLGYLLLLLIIYERKWGLTGSIYFEAMIESSFILAGVTALFLP
jgi:4-hydroxybenzoate polyprenyltransferase